jgi:H+/Cl- antiporter ClcA
MLFSLFSPDTCVALSLGFNAAVAGCFFAIETVLRPLRAENSPPFTTAMIILASVISSTVSNVLLGEKAAFIVPTVTTLPYPRHALWGSECGIQTVGGLVHKDF